MCVNNAKKHDAECSLSQYCVNFADISNAFMQRKSDTDETRAFALGLGLTNECNLACSFCYRDPNRVDRLTLEQVRKVMNTLPVQSVNLGTGENGMHPDFVAILDF